MESFRKACAEVKSNVHLRALGTVFAVNDVLEAICPATASKVGQVEDARFFNDLCLDAVDAFVIQRVGRHIVRFDRVKSAAEEKDDNGRSLFLEINEVRQRSATVSHHVFRMVPVLGPYLGPYAPYALTAAVSMLGSWLLSRVFHRPGKSA